MIDEAVPAAPGTRHLLEVEDLRVTFTLPGGAGHRRKAQLTAVDRTRSSTLLMPRSTCLSVTTTQ